MTAQTGVDGIRTGGDTECRVSSRAMDSVQCRTCQLYSGSLLEDYAGQSLAATDCAPQCTYVLQQKMRMHKIATGVSMSMVCSRVTVWTH